MSSVAQLNPSEIVHIDSVALALCLAQPCLSPELLLEDIAMQICSIESAWANGEFSRLTACAASLVPLASQMGMDRLALVATQTAELAENCDSAALSASVCRLTRVGEASLYAMWDTGIMRI